MARGAGFARLVKTLERTALLEVPPEVAYEVVIDVAQYPQFLPGCERVQVLENHASVLVAQVSVAGKGLQESFVTSNVHRPYESVTMSLQQGPFEYLQGQWLFTPLGDVGCKVDLRIEYLPKGVLVRLLSSLADRIANRLVDAFSERIAQQNVRDSASGH